MIYRNYGGGEEKVSLIGMGTARLSGDPARFDEQVELVLKAFELGINYFDTAPAYASGEAEKILGTAFKQIPREKFYTVSKSLVTFDPTADDVLRRIEKSLKILNVDYIDFFHMWSVLTAEQYHKIIAKGGPYEGALRAKEQGLIRHICFSAHCNGDTLEEIISSGKFDGVTLGFNALNYRHRLPGIKIAGAHGMGVAIMNPLGGGLIPRNPDYFKNLEMFGGSVATGAVKFVAAHKDVSTVLIGANKISDLTEAVAAIEGIEEISEEQCKNIADKLPVPEERLCTMCDYCRGCPKNIFVSRMMGAYNEYILSGRNEAHFHEWRKMFCDAYPIETVDCIKCGRCESVCTQHLPIIKRIEKINEICGKEAARYRQVCEKFLPPDNKIKVGIYGLSMNAETLINACKYFYGKMPPNVYFFDSYYAKWGRKVFNTDYITYAPKDIKPLGIEKILITAPRYEKAIREFLKDYVAEGTTIDAL